MINVLYPETLTLSGNVLIQAHDLTGALVHSEVVHNIIPLTGRNLLARLLAGDTARQSNPPSHIAIGTATSGPADTDTQLGNEVYRSVITQTVLGASSISYKLFVPATAANNPSSTQGQRLFEACIYNSSELVPVPPMLSRVVHSEIKKTGNITVTYTWTHSIVASP